MHIEAGDETSHYFTPHSQPDTHANVQSGTHTIVSCPDRNFAKFPPGHETKTIVVHYAPILRPVHATKFSVHACYAGELALQGCTVHVYDGSSLTLQTLHSTIDQQLQQLRDCGLLPPDQQLRVGQHIVFIIIVFMQDLIVLRLTCSVHVKEYSNSIHMVFIHNMASYTGGQYCYTGECGSGVDSLWSCN